jgi:hypothetical protein
MGSLWVNAVPLVSSLAKGRESCRFFFPPSAGILLFQWFSAAKRRDISEYVVVVVKAERITAQITIQIVGEGVCQQKGIIYKRCKYIGKVE